MSNEFAKCLLDWYGMYGRDLPWRFKGGAHPDPYVVLVSEVMLQQTTVKTVLSYFEKFINRFPDVTKLANADEEEVLLYWQGLGYYTRAKSLHQSAKMIATEFEGKFPSTKEDVLKLKGLGPYAVASFLALAFNAPETVVDGNVVRIISRLYHLTKPQDEMMPEIRKKAESLTDKENAADYASAIMDLGATVCTKKKPACGICPVQKFCASKGLPDLEQIPARKKIEKKNFDGYVFIISNKKGEVFIRRRTEKGLLSGLYEFLWSNEKIFANAVETSMSVSHVFTHIKMNLKICRLSAEKIKNDGFFVLPQNLKKYAFSTLMKKVIKKADLG
ncbi:MAG: A/G-specific adenine glycosylase [Alphaproteobacteria bacterium]|nr:A/G-specific adenine glycosylase [Alphaproteobacteria bacterium]